MVAFMGAIQAVLALGLPIASYLVVRRRQGHTRWQLVVAAGIGGGVAGAVTATLAAAGGASFADALPFALLGLATGLVIGLLGLAAFALGRWLSREP